MIRRWFFVLIFVSFSLHARPLVYVVMAVSSMGKSTQGEKLAALLKAPFYDADDYHPESNRKKISAGAALTDEDRWPWLDRLKHEVIERHLREGTTAVTACSALRQAYRKRLGIPDPRIQLVYLKGTLEMALANNKKRKGHFAPEQTVRNNFKVLEEPLPEEKAVVVMVHPTDIQITFQRMIDVLGLK